MVTSVSLRSLSRLHLTRSVKYATLTMFFKLIDYHQTSPNKAINRSTGLSDISVSVTGGSIDAQGMATKRQTLLNNH